MRSARLLLTLAIIVVFAILFHILGLLRPLELVFVKTVRPVQTAFSRWFQAIAGETSQSQSERIEELEKEVALQQVGRTQADEALRQCQSASAQASALGRRALLGVNATVIGRSPEGDTQVLLIDRGTDNGIQNEFPVVADSGVLIGTVVDAQAGRSSILLLTNTQSSIGAEVQNETRSPGIVNGERGLALRLRSVPQNEALAAGDLVVTSALNEKIPAGLPIGAITDVHFAIGDLFQEASVRPPLDYQRVRYVSVITP